MPHLSHFNIGGFFIYPLRHNLLYSPQHSWGIGDFIHFSRNPNIARFLHEYDYVQEFGEGIDRMFNEMAAAGPPAPEYRDNAFMLNATIRNGVINEVINGAINISAAEQAVLAAITQNPRITKVELLGKSTIERAIKALKEKCLIERVDSNKTGYWKIINKGAVK